MNMVNINPALSVITFNVNGLNALVKRDCKSRFKKI